MTPTLILTIAGAALLLIAAPWVLTWYAIRSLRKSNAEWAEHRCTPRPQSRPQVRPAHTMAMPPVGPPRPRQVFARSKPAETTQRFDRTAT